MRHIRHVAIAVATLLFTSTAHAQDAKKCIEIKMGKEFDWYTKEARYLTNTCVKELEVVWCVETTSPPDAQCGKDGKFYQKHTSLKPGERKFNMYTVPPEGTIRYGACFGGWYSVDIPDKTKDAYHCKVKK